MPAKIYVLYMLTRRHIRAKVMQSIYAFKQSKSEQLNQEEKFLKKSMEDMYDLFLLNLQLLVEIQNKAEKYLEIVQKKHLATAEERNPNLKFLSNLVIEKLKDSDALINELEKRKLKHWHLDDEYPAAIWDSLRTSEIYESYVQTHTNDFKEDKEFVVQFFKKIVAPTDRLYDYYEDQKLTWVDDLPIVNTSILKFLQKIKANDENLSIPSLFKNFDDEQFGKQLFQKTMLNEDEYLADVKGKTPGWDQDRYAELDRVLITMGLCEFVKFPSIPVKVTINEYLELAKEYSTPRSSIFINGVLDKLAKEYKASGKINKIGRGLM
ncbi:transcription antitermination protein NusB [Psychroflexus planctonicus]|nr:transcription antitermination protein NusB [Psychroflexus planctonicus]